MFFVGLSGLIVTGIISIWANSLFKHLEQLPMQWGAAGQVNWSAPRLVALSFFPALSLFISLYFYLGSINHAQKYSIDSLILILAVLVFVQLIYFYIVKRADNKKR
ncbi:hypothetical protein IAE29_22810 [Ochrobactrum sp. S46]|nr:hypothetical protein [Ochrobactrum sp. S45]MBK0046164.1 hypothetical protein [Ochrobactrum sp. S46]